MKKIMFNDKYGLTAAVLKGYKTMTRRIIKAPRRTIEGKEVCGFAIYKTSDGVPYEVWLTGPDEESLCQLLPTYKVGEIVAVAQSYESMANGGYLDRMTVPADAEVFMVADWSETDEYGCLTELRELNGVTSQVHVEDMGLDFEDVTEVLLYFG